MAKRGAGKTVDHYVDLIKQSWEVTWKHKELWFFGILAAILNTGSVFTMVVRSIRRIEPADVLSERIVAQAVNGAPWLLQYVRNLIQFDAARVVIMVSIFLFVAVLIVLTALGGQQLLVTGLHRSEKRKKHLSLRKLFKHLEHLHILRLFAVNALAYLAMNITLIAAALPLSLLLGADGLQDSLVYAGMYLLLIPIAFGVDALAMFTLINVIRRNAGLQEAFTHSYQLLKQNWLIAFEVAVLLYLFNLAAPVMFLLIAALIAIFASVIGFASLSSGTAVLLTVITVLSVAVVVLFLFAVSGLIVTFNYSMWLHLMMKLERKSILPTIEYLATSLLKRRRR